MAGEKDLLLHNTRDNTIMHAEAANNNYTDFPD